MQFLWSDHEHENEEYFAASLTLIFEESILTFLKMRIGTLATTWTISIPLCLMNVSLPFFRYSVFLVYLFPQIWSPCREETDTLFIVKNQNKPVTLPKNLIRIPLVRQGTNWTCGVAAFQSVLYALANEEWREDKLTERLKATPEDGTDHREMVAFARELGLSGSAFK